MVMFCNCVPDVGGYFDIQYIDFWQTSVKTRSGTRAGAIRRTRQAEPLPGTSHYCERLTYYVFYTKISNEIQHKYS